MSFFSRSNALARLRRRTKGENSTVSHEVISQFLVKLRSWKAKLPIIVMIERMDETIPDEVHRLSTEVIEDKKKD
jgi:hypothetical protein